MILTLLALFLVLEFRLSRVIYITLLSLAILPVFHYP